MAGQPGRSGGHNKLPDAVKKQRGSLKSIRVNKDAPDLPTLSGIPAPPGWMDKPAALEEWRTVWLALQGYNMLTEIDKNALAMYCDAMADFIGINAEVLTYTITNDKGLIVVNPLLRAKRDAFDRAVSLGKEFGFTPVARTRVVVVKKDEGKSDDDDLLN